MTFIALHITNWYPSLPTPRSAPFIKKHIDALGLYTKNKVWHVEIRKGKLSFHGGVNPDGSHYMLLALPFLIWRLNEWLYYLMVRWVLFKEKTHQYDLINFHIAYPLAIYIKSLQKTIKVPMVITEHWSAYHFNFNITRPDKLVRIKNIFRHNIPIITVSKSLAIDIQRFSDREQNIRIIPNVVDTDTFRYLDIPVRDNTFFMVSQWNQPKKPLLVIDAWPLILKEYPNAQLRIGGYGNLWEAMQRQIKTLKLENNITLLGYLKPETIARELNTAQGFIHLSDYETFSVVCAEAACCGTPVIASTTGGIPEFISEKNGVLIKNKINGLVTAIKKVMKTDFDRPTNAKAAQQQFNPQVIGQRSYATLEEIINAARQ